MRFSSLGSGSKGNALIVQVGETVVMMDCGFGLAATEVRLARVGLTPESLDAVLVTHEHADHIGGVARFARKYKLPIWLTHGTAKVLNQGSVSSALLNFVDPHAEFSVGNVQVTPYFVPHDAFEPVQYVFSDGNSRLGVLTDTGSITTHIENTLSGCDALVLECNHDLDMLMNGPYPDSLKKRVSGKFGHLDNLTAASLLAGIDCSRLKHIIAAHLSERNNLPALATAALAGALGCETGWIGIADQESGFTWREI